MEQTEKATGVQPILDELYAIRAGMSLISQKKDEFEKMYTETINFIKTSTDNVGAPIYNIDHIVNGKNGSAEKVMLAKKDRKELQQCTEPINFARLENKYAFHDEESAPALNARLVDLMKIYYSDAQKDIDNIENAVSACNAKRKKSQKKAPLCFSVFFGILCAACVIAWIASVIVYLPYEVTFALGAGIITLVILTVIMLRKHNKNVTYRKLLEQVIQSCETAIDAIRMLSAESEKKYNELSPYILTLTKDCNNLYRTLETQCDIIDPRDWKYVDTLIFYFETGRVDTMKEALQHLDHEIHTQQIVQTIVHATQYLAETIRASVQQIADRLIHIEVLQTAQLKQLMLQTALLQKISASSEQLASDVSYMHRQA